MHVDTLNPRLKNCLKNVMEYKDISKMILMMQTAVLQAKPKVHNLLNQYQGFGYLWKDTRNDELRNLVASDAAITEIQAVMRSYNDLETDIEKVTKSHRAGPLEIRTADLKLGLSIEVKEWKLALCRFMGEKYRLQAIEISKFIDACNKELNIPIRDMHEILTVLKVLQRIRDNFINYDMLIGPIEECYAFLIQQKYKVSDDDVKRANGLRERFDNLQKKVKRISI